ncbi:MAG TPA: hypothetical protein VFE27_23070 [Acidobacteriaceae bacterium]|jgi:hypothetical protein|nr:hypothetical protein [Acidobacteriaceae bacterium]
MAADGGLQLKKIDEEMGSFFGGLADLGQFDRGGEAGEDAAAVDDRTNAKAGVEKYSCQEKILIELRCLSLTGDHILENPRNSRSRGKVTPRFFLAW